MLQGQSDRFSPNSLSSHSAQDRRSPTTHIPPAERSRSPIGFQSRYGGSFYGDRSARTSPTALSSIPPITISNPSETYEIVQKSMESERSPLKPDAPAIPLSTSSQKLAGATTPGSASSSTTVPEKKEKTSVMKEILAFVRKPSKKVTTRTSKFAAAFSRADSNTGAPLLRQSTFSSIQNSSSCAGRNAITKQMSEIGFEPIMTSLKLKGVSSKISLKSLRKFSSDKKDKKSSGDEISDVESSDGGKITSEVGNMAEVPFELDNVKFEKVGESYIKHDQIKEEESPRGSQESEEADDGRLKITAVSEIKKSLEALFTRQEPIDEAAEDQRKDSEAIQCPTFEIEPPSRRASFDPPRSPYLENLRSLSDTDHEGTHHSRLDSGGDSFELIDTTDRRGESSVSDRHSSMDTSFDISRYQSTSYEDQNSSFELVELDNSQRTSARDDKISPFDIRKSSIELVDAETFQRSYPEGRKSSLETHFDLAEGYQPTSPRSAFTVIPKARKQISEPGRNRDHKVCMKTHYSAPHRAKSPLSNQTSSNYSSRDSYDSIFESMPHYEVRSPFSDRDSKQHFPLPRKSSNESSSRFLCTDKRCASIFEPRPARLSSTHLDTSSGSEFEPPSPRRAASASPKHTFTFRIVLKKVDSSPDAICPSAERRNTREKLEKSKRRDSRRKKLLEIGKSF